MEILEGLLGLKLKVVVAGAVGSFVSLRFFDGLKTGERWLTFVGGWALAAYGTGLVHEYFELKSSAAETGVALLIGVFGMSIVAAVIKLIRETDWVAIFRRKTGGGE